MSFVDCSEVSAGACGKICVYCRCLQYPFSIVAMWSVQWEWDFTLVPYSFWAVVCLTICVASVCRFARLRSCIVRGDFALSPVWVQETHQMLLFGACCNSSSVCCACMSLDTAWSLGSLSTGTAIVCVPLGPVAAKNALL